MALQRADSCDLYTDYNDIYRRYPSSYLASAVSIYPTSGRFGGACWSANNANCYIEDVVSGAPTTYHWSGAVQQRIAYSLVRSFIELRNATGSIAAVKIISGGYIQAYRGTTALGSASASPVITASWTFLEIKVVIHASTGSVLVYADGNEVLNETGLNTEGFSGGVSRIRMWPGDGQGAVYFDDTFHFDTTGSGVNDFTGDRRIDYLPPNGDGTVQLTKSGGSTNWELVDETAGADDDSTYVYSSTIGHKDILDLQTLAATAVTVDAVQAVCVANKSDAGAGGLKIGVKSGTTEGLSGAKGLSTDYKFFEHILELNPDDAAPWADGDMAGLQVVYEVT